ncbi:MAG: hydantoinase/oxoprolinase family protein [Conexibacter sp.]|nr:hydantoinase/oxoprolinase family protein [Conexibacter sp.]
MEHVIDASADQFAVGVDVGGTHTDLMLSTPSGLVRSKSFTTHDDYSRGIFDSLTVAAGQLDMTVPEVLSRCRAFVNGTTIVTNAVTELRGAKVGVLITEGFKDTFRIARGARPDDYDDHAQVSPPDVIARDCIEEIQERVTSDGDVAVALDEEAVREAVRRLRAKGVDAIAVCYLWSFKAPQNEQRTGAIVAEEFPEAFVTLSSDVHPVIREYERFMTAVFNCLSHRATTRYVHQLEELLAANRFDGTLSFFQGIGGSVGSEAVTSRPITLLGSGPAGGVMGVRHVAEQLGIDNVLIGDMGGTSFDTSLLANRQPTIAKRVAFGQLDTGISIIDVISVGAGGGSIARIDSRGVPQVGPHSAGSEPGPAAYGRGGEEPTVTDAMIALGLINPDNYLQGRHQLDPAAAAAAIEERIAKPLGWSVEAAAAGIHDLAVTNMANALREVSVERGYDPRDFTFFCYGGMLPLFAAQICRELGCPEIVIPDNSSAFSAYGVLIADYVRQYERTVQWSLSDESQVGEVNRVTGEMIDTAIAEAAREGISADELEIERSGDFRFLGQVYEVNVPLPSRDLTPEDGAELAEQFPRIYERAYGEGTAWKGSPVVLLNMAIKVTYRREKPPGRGQAAAPAGPAEVEPLGSIDVFLPAERRRQSIHTYAEASLTPGSAVEGPCVVDVGDTTIYVPEGVTCSRDNWFNFRLSLEAKDASR